MSDSLLNNTINKIVAPGPTIAKGVGDFWGNLGSFWKLIFILITVIIFVLIINLGIYLITYWGSTSQNIPVYLTNGVSNGYTANSIIQNPKTNPDTYVLRSNNRYGGTEFTWSIWLNVKDIVSNGKPNTFQNIFNKGNNQYDPITGIATINNAPGLYLSKETNTLRIIMDTIVPNPTTANNYTDITNIPLGKWFHLAIRLQDRNLDTYVNGIIATRLYLVDVPKQNFDTIYVCQNGGFSGNYSDLFYFNYALSVYSIQKLVMDGPGLNYSKVHIQSETSTLSRSATDNYLSPLWYFGEISSQIDLSYNGINIPKRPPVPPEAPASPEAPAPPASTQYESPELTAALIASDKMTQEAKDKTSGLDTTAGAIGEVLSAEEKAVIIQEAEQAGVSEKTAKLTEEKTAQVIEETKQKADATLQKLTTDTSTSDRNIVDIIKAVAFAIGSLFSTKPDDIMGGDVRALNKHNIDCSGNAINSFQYIDLADKTINYKYRCSMPNGGNLSEVKPYSTKFTETTGSTIDLGKQSEDPVQCPANSVLSQFKLVTDPETTGTQLKYEYKCLEGPANSTLDPLQCNIRSTDIYKANRKSTSLGRANIKCFDNEALSGFKYVSLNNASEYRYDYTCCKTAYA